MANFASKTALRTYVTPLTAQLDFLGHPGQLRASIGAAPGSQGLSWPAPPEPREPSRLAAAASCGSFRNRPFRDG